MTIINDDSSVIIKWSSKLIDAARGVIYNHHMFIVQATGEEWFLYNGPGNENWALMPHNCNTSYSYKNNVISGNKHQRSHT